MTWMPGKRPAMALANSGSYSTTARRWGTIRSRSADVMAPVPGPSSSTSPGRLVSISLAMARASARPEGATAPTCFGRVINARQKRRLSANGSFFRESAFRIGTSLRGLAAFPKLFQLGHETFGFGLAALAGFLLEFAQEFFLL